MDGASDDSHGSTLVEFHSILPPRAPRWPCPVDGSWRAAPRERNRSAGHRCPPTSGPVCPQRGGVPSSPSLRLCDLGQLTRPLSLTGLSASVTWQKLPGQRGLLGPGEAGRLDGWSPGCSLRPPRAGPAPPIPAFPVCSWPLPPRRRILPEDTVWVGSRPPPCAPIAEKEGSPPHGKAATGALPPLSRSLVPALTGAL